MKSFHRILLVVSPGVIGAILFAILLGHRSDYLGHYLAGLGGTLAATLFLLSILPRDPFERWAGPAIFGVCLGCIALGAGTEATIFKIAKFDEIDFCNQSLGAVVAALSCQAAWREKPAMAPMAVGAIAGLLFLMAGFHYAFA